MFDRDRPFNDLPELPPDGDIETPSVLRAVIRAQAALSKLAVAEQWIPDPSILVKAIALQEAKLSAEIENIVTTNDDLYRTMAGANPDSPRTREVLRYSEGLWHGYGRLRERREFTPELFDEIASLVNSVPTQPRTRSGTRIGSMATGKVIYTPPDEPDLIRQRLEGLANYLNQQDGHVDLVRMAVAHYQFEAIHPYHDGNGRTGRILNVLFLCQRGLIHQPILYLSGFILERRLDYYAGLRGVTERGDWQSWLAFIIEGVEVTAIETRRRIEALKQAIDATRIRVRSVAPNLAENGLVELIFERPYVRITDVVEAGIAKRQTASSYLNCLADAGVLRREQRWRESLFVNDAMLLLISV